MGIKKYVNQIGAGIASTKQLAMLTPEVQKIVSEFSRDEIKEALEDDAKLQTFAETVYSKLPIGIKAKLSKEWFIEEMVKRKDLLMSKKSNKKKLRKKKK